MNFHVKGAMQFSIKYLCYHRRDRKILEELISIQVERLTVHTVVILEETNVMVSPGFKSLNITEKCSL